MHLGGGSTSSTVIEEISDNPLFDFMMECHRLDNELYSIISESDYSSRIVTENSNNKDSIIKKIIGKIKELLSKFVKAVKEIVVKIGVVIKNLEQK